MPFKSRAMRLAYDRARRETHAAYTREWYPKGRSRRTYLTDRQHRMIRAACETERMVDVARAYGVSYSTVKDIKYGRTIPRCGQAGRH